MKIIYKVLIIGFVLSVFTTQAQQDTHYSFYRYNMNLVNPAFAGINGETVFGINFRSQWSSIVGAPETQSAFFGTPVDDKVGLGLSVINDRTFIEQQTSVMVDFSYKLQLDDHNNLYFGIKAGTNSYSANTEGLQIFDPSADPSLTNLNGGFKLNVGLGALIKGKRYFIAVSAPKMLASARLEGNEGEIALNESRMHAYIAGGYDVRLSREVVFKPSVMLRHIKAAPLSVDLTGSVQFKDRVEFGISYRIDEGTGGMFIWKAADWMNLGYAYIAEFESAIGKNGRGSHEIFLNFSL
ncbi:PorP/SprF family type IX secretion system membrane protein [Robertkochia sediminum]|uniref:PorP/SprF family type IX secretion system membrane protein n=1 Tax=Robertkochia sediminum TaxID=2785326 RepID=UPI00193498AC|nr:type IX secretion system membrane protein PorP/SprF [Robertkochia sediminum]MBL7474179.1 type IX secretion system membrane protein PorP/SprF [Robertkochia sediminum]